MAHMVRASLRAPCFTHKPSFTHSDLEKVKLVQNYDDGTKKMRYCPQFTGKYGIECLLCSVERFVKCAACLDYDEGPELFSHFEEILEDNAQDTWENITTGVPDVEHTPDRFNQEIDNFYQRYCDPQARDSMFEYLKSFSKPHYDSPRDYADRMVLMIRHANKLPGTEPLLNEQQSKNIIFQGVPMTWKQNYIRAGKDVATDTLEEILQYMSNEKGFSDQRSGNKNEDDSKKRKKKGEATESNKKPSFGPEAPCRKPGHEHLWKNCPDNPNGRKHRPNPNFSNGGRGFGGGRGRGNFGGQGFSRGGGRGGFQGQGRGGFQGGRGHGGYGGRGYGNYQGNNHNGGRGYQQHAQSTNGANQGFQAQNYYANGFQAGTQFQTQGTPEGDSSSPRGGPPMQASQGWGADVHHFDMVGYGLPGGSAEMAEDGSSECYSNYPCAKRGPGR